MWRTIRGAVFLALLAGVGLSAAAVEWSWFGTGIRYEITKLETSVLDLPVEVVGHVCWVFVWHNLGTMGAFDRSFFAAWYAEDADGSWIGGPTASIAGVGHSGGQGVNGDYRPDVVHQGGSLVHGGTFLLVDDSSNEGAPRSQWTLQVAWPESIEEPEDPRIVILVQPIL